MVLIKLVITLVIILGISYFIKVPVIYILLGLSIWVFIAHFVTLDDDFEGGWSNPDGSSSIWDDSKRALLIKFLSVVFIFFLLVMFPNLGEF